MSVRTVRIASFFFVLFIERDLDQSGGFTLEVDFAGDELSG
jgi:hypothetical protein